MLARPSFQLTTFVAAAFVSLALSPSALAYEACDKCDIEGIKKEMADLAAESIALTEEAAKKYGEAADNYQDALDDAKELGSSLIPSVDVFSLCGAIDELKGKIEQAQSTLSGFLNLIAGSGNEAAAAELRRKADWRWGQMLKMAKCLKECCDARDQAPKLVVENPGTDFTAAVPEADLRKCLEKLSPNDRKTLLNDANAGRLGDMHKDNVAAIKALVTSSGALKK